jgi:hypothetical protein
MRERYRQSHRARPLAQTLRRGGCGRHHYAESQLTPTRTGALQLTAGIRLRATTLSHRRRATRHTPTRLRMMLPPKSSMSDFAGGRKRPLAASPKVAFLDRRFPQRQRTPAGQGCPFAYARSHPSVTRRKHCQLGYEVSARPDRNPHLERPGKRFRWHFVRTRVASAPSSTPSAFGPAHFCRGATRFRHRQSPDDFHLPAPYPRSQVRRKPIAGVAYQMMVTVNLVVDRSMRRPAAPRSDDTSGCMNTAVLAVAASAARSGRHADIQPLHQLSRTWPWTGFSGLSGGDRNDGRKLTLQAAGLSGYGLFGLVVSARTASVVPIT